jgi:hypothetical protein
MHEVVFSLYSPPLDRAADLPVDRATRERLVRAARDRGIDDYVVLCALVAQKLALASGAQRNVRDMAVAIGELLDALAYDVRAPKRDTLAALAQLKKDIEARAAHVRQQRLGGYQFLDPPELYRDRADPKERPDAFFNRVYRSHVRRGLTQADLRRADPAFYNVLHVFCSRAGRKMTAFAPPQRARRRP